MPGCTGFRLKFTIKFVHVDDAGFETRPGIAVGVPCIDAAQEIDGQIAPLLETAKRHKRTFGHHAAEIPEYGAYRRIGHRYFLAFL